MCKTYHILHLMQKSIPLTWHSLHWNHLQPLMDVVSVGDSLSEIAPKGEDIVKGIDIMVKMK